MLNKGLCLLQALGLLLIVSCRPPQLIEVSYDAKTNRLVKPAPAKPGSSASTEIEVVDRYALLNVGVGTSIGVTVTSVPAGQVVRFRKTDFENPALPMPTQWNALLGDKAEPSKSGIAEKVNGALPTKPEALPEPPSETKASQGEPSSSSQPPPAGAKGTTATPGMTTADLRPQAAIQKSEEADNKLAQVIATRRAAGAMFRQAKEHQAASESYQAFQDVVVAEALVQGLPDDPLKQRLITYVATCKDTILDGDPLSDLKQRDAAHRALSEVSQRLAKGNPDEARLQLQKAEESALKLGSEKRRLALIKSIQTIRELVDNATSDATLPLFTFTDKDFELRVEVVPVSAAATDPNDSRAITHGFYIRAQQSHDWVLFPSTGFALSNLVDKNYGLKGKEIVDQGGDQARAEAMFMMNFQPKATTNNSFPWLMGLGVGTTGGDTRYYLSPLGISLGRWGALHVGVAGGKVMRLKESIDRSNYTGTAPNEDRQSVFRFGTFFALSARFSK